MEKEILGGMAKVTVSDWFIKLLIFAIVVLAAWLLFNSGEIYGGKKACMSMDGYLTDGFVCEFPLTLTNRTFGRINPPSTLKLGNETEPDSVK